MEKVVATVTELLGPVRIVEDHSWPGVELAVVLRLRMEDGHDVIAKSHAGEVNFAQELAAYRTWVQALGDRAPQLLAVDEEARVIVLSALPGVDLEEAVASGTAEQAVYADAGSLVRRLHEAHQPAVDDAWAESVVASLEKWIGRAAPGVLDPDDVAWVRRQVQQLLDTAPPPLVVCHGDWQPRNWRIDAGVVRAFDFERTKPDWWILDFQRMLPRDWRNRPDLADAFFDGYGRRPSEAELHATWALCACRMLMQIPYALEHGDEGFADGSRETLRWMRSEETLRLR